jgi:hypothetical protein
MTITWRREKANSRNMVHSQILSDNRKIYKVIPVSRPNQWHTPLENYGRKNYFKILLWNYAVIIYKTRINLNWTTPRQSHHLYDRQPKVNRHHMYQQVKLPIVIAVFNQPYNRPIITVIYGLFKLINKQRFIYINPSSNDAFVTYMPFWYW